MNGMPMRDLLTAALDYGTRGWRVFPCHTPTRTGCSCGRADCASPGKHPRFSGWQREASIDAATITRWWKRWPTANIGIAAGRQSGVVVLDEDSYKGGDATRLELEHRFHPLPETVQQLTGGGGIQYLFAPPADHAIPNSVQHLGAGLDVRGDGGLFIAPPSLHQSGKRYAWELSHLPEETPLAPFPAWLFHLVVTPPATPHPATPADQPILDGARNDTLFRLGCSLRHRGLTPAVILAALGEMNATQCRPPLPDADVQTIARQCGQYQQGPPPAGARPDQGTAEDPQAALHGTPFADIPPHEAQWLWWPYLAKGTLAMLDGDPGVGKTILTHQLAACISRGWGLPGQDGKPGPARDPGTVLFFSGEDHPGIIRARLERAGADLRRILLMGGVGASPETTVPFTFAHLPELARYVEDHRPALIVLDPIQAYLGARVDMHRANETRPLLTALTAIAMQWQPALLCVRHPAKASGVSGVKAMMRGIGSVDFTGIARTVLFAEEYPGDRTRTVLAQSKGNLAIAGVSQVYSTAHGLFEWRGVTRITAEMIAGGGRGPDPWAYLEAVAWLEERLSQGSVAADTMVEESARAEISEKVLRRAKKSLGVKSVQGVGQWNWMLPPRDLRTEESEKRAIEEWDTGGNDDTGITTSTGTSDSVTSQAYGAVKANNNSQPRPVGYGAVDMTKDLTDGQGTQVPQVSQLPVAPCVRVNARLMAEEAPEDSRDANAVPEPTIPPTPPPAHVEALADVYTTEWKDHIEPSLWDADPEDAIDEEDFA